MEPDREILTAYSESAHQITQETAKVMLVTKPLLTSVIYCYIFSTLFTIHLVMLAKFATDYGLKETSRI